MIIVMKVIIILIILMIFVMVMVMTISYEVICPLAYAVSLILIPKLKKNTDEKVPDRQENIHIHIQFVVTCILGHFRYSYKHGGMFDMV